MCTSPANLLTQKWIHPFSTGAFAKLSTGLLTPCIEFGWNYNDIFKDITFKLRTEFVFWFAEKKMLLKTET